MMIRSLSFSCYLFFLLVSSNESKKFTASFGFPDLKRKQSTKSDKDVFLESLDRWNTLNTASIERTSLLNQMIQSKQEVLRLNRIKSSPLSPNQTSVPAQSLMNPGRLSSFSMVANGTWKVIYAPHMTTISGIFGGSFDVSYILYDNLTIVSHARYEFPVIGRGYLSTSGTYGSVNDTVSQVRFHKVWFKPLAGNKSIDDGPYNELDDVPDSFMKSMINSIGQTFFVESVSVFPVSFLDDDLCVFDFELLGTRICAKKIL